MEYGLIKSRSIELNEDGEKKVMLLELEVSEEDDLQEVEMVSQAGEDYNPPDSSKAYFIRLSDSFGIVFAVDDGIEPDETIEQGEREIYSSDSGERKAKIRLKKDQSIVLNDGTDFAIQFTAMQTAFDTLKQELNALIQNYNTFITHTHVITAPTQQSGPPVPAPPGVPATADMSSSKVEKVNL